MYICIICINMKQKRKEKTENRKEGKGGDFHNLREPDAFSNSVPIGRGIFVPMTLAADTQVVTDVLNIKNSTIQFDRRNTNLNLWLISPHTILLLYGKICRLNKNQHVNKTNIIPTKI